MCFATSFDVGFYRRYLKNLDDLQISVAHVTSLAVGTTSWSRNEHDLR